MNRELHKENTSLKVLTWKIRGIDTMSEAQRQEF